MAIVTDTNVLYGIEDGTYDFERVKQLPLVITALNLIELVSSPKIKNDFGYNLVLNVCRTIYKLNPTYNLFLPYDFAAREYFGKKLKNKVFLRSFIDFCKHGIPQSLRNESVELRQQRVFSFKQGMIEQIAVVKNNTESIEKLSDVNSAADSSATDFALELKKLTGVNPWTADRSKVLRKGKGLDLYIRARARYNQKLTFVKEYLPAGNDQLDLANLMYVKHEDLYWTTDTKLIKNINDVGMGHKLFTY